MIRDVIRLKSAFLLVLITAAFVYADYEQRVICGREESGDYTDRFGYAWHEDQAYSSGSWGYTNAGEGVAAFYNNIENAYDWPLYQSERWGGTVSYRFDVPGPGTYFVKIMLAEIWFGVHARDGIGSGIGERIFNITVNDQALTDYDMLEKTGGRAARAIIEEFMIAIPDGSDYSIEIEAVGVVEKAKISAIEISTVPTLTDVIDDYEEATNSGAESLKINCGGTKSRAGNGDLWMADEAYEQCRRWGYMNGQAKAKAPYDWIDTASYRKETWRAGDETLEYRIALPNGQYDVNLIFCENEINTTGGRRFDVAVQDSTVALNLDVYQAAGFNTAYIIPVVADVTDSILKITFPNVTAGQAMISGIDINAGQVSDEAFLDFIEKRSIDYFVQTGDPYGSVKGDNGLVIDHANNFISIPWTTVPSSVAGLGFRLAVLSAAMARGWLAPVEASGKAKTLLQFMAHAIPFDESTGQDNVTHKEGFYFHMLKPGGGRDGSSELSSVDSAMFFAGAVIASAGFADQSVKDLAATILERANWPWFTDNHEDDFVAMQWMPPSDPQAGFTNFWDKYNEGVLVNLLALGSQNQPVNPSCWFNMGRQWYDDPLYPHMMEASAWAPLGLFTHLFPQCFFDLRDVQDDKNNYYENSRMAVYANRAYCLGQPSVATYAEGNWGLSDGFTPVGGYSYMAYGPNPNSHQGTVNPNIVGASVAFAPEIAVPALRKMFFQYKHFLWGRYGLADGFNLNAPQTLDSTVPSGQGWVASDVVVLNLGALILGIDNYRTGHVWAQSRKTSVLTQAMDKIGMCCLTIEDFENDKHYDDEVNARDGEWWPSNSPVYQLATQQDVSGNTTTCLKVTYDKGEVEKWSYVAVKGLSSPANMSYFRQPRISMDIKGNAKVMLKFKDLSGRESGDSQVLSGGGGDDWETLTWSLETTDWGGCDNKMIEEVLVFIEPGEPAQGALYLDNISLKTNVVQPAITPAQDVMPEAAVDKYNRILAYPNPGREQVWFTWPEKQADKVEVVIYNSAGEKIAQISEDSLSERKIGWLPGHTAPGLYLYRFVFYQNDQIEYSPFHKFAIIR